MVFQRWGLATQPALFYEVKRSWNTSDNGKSLVTPIQLVPALLPAAAVCKRALISGAEPHVCPGPAWSWSCRAWGRCGACAHQPLANGVRGSQVLQWKRGAGRGERGPWAAHRLCAGPRGRFSCRQLGVPVLVSAYVCKPDHLPPDNVPITCWWLYGEKKTNHAFSIEVRYSDWASFIAWSVDLGCRLGKRFSHWQSPLQMCLLICWSLQENMTLVHRSLTWVGLNFIHCLHRKMTDVWFSGPN